MTTIALFDTLAFAKRLIEGGVPANQAEAQAEAMFAVMDDKLATKKDLEELGIATKRDMEELGAGTKRDMEELRAGTKRDIEELRAGTKKDMEELRAGTKRDIYELRNDLQRDLLEMSYKLTIRLGGMMVIAISALSLIIKL